MCVCCSVCVAVCMLQCESCNECVAVCCNACVAIQSGIASFFEYVRSLVVQFALKYCVFQPHSARVCFLSFLGAVFKYLWPVDVFFVCLLVYDAHSCVYVLP